MLFAAIALASSYLVRFDFTLGAAVYQHHFWYTLWLNIVIFTIFSGVFNLFQGIWRYVSVSDLKDIVFASGVSTLVFTATIAVSGHFGGYPRSIYLLDFFFFILYNGGTRFAIRTFRETFAPMSDNACNVLIVGAGTVGNEIVKTLRSSKRREFIPIGFIDKDHSLTGQRIQGLKVFGDMAVMRQVIMRHRVREVFIAIPEATNKLVSEIVDSAKILDWEIKFKITPSTIDIMSGKYRVDQIREVSINDLLSRPNITLDDSNVRNRIAGKSVLVTGAGGSIGSEICHQIAQYRPTRLVLLDAGEENAYRIDRDLKQRYPEIAVNTIVGSMLDSAVIDTMFREFDIDIVYHAAAYKHVHLMEWNPISCMKNNVLGTYALVSAAEKSGVKQFVMVSTDKAVNPRGIMGISKRLAERIVLERYPSATRFNVVRFGNVLGSSGSVIPLFQRQIREGGPVTVTHPDTRRFFMSIPEAVQLVLQASSLNEKNAIFMLEMGEPVRIVDLARNLIELSGFKVGDDIDIVFTGLRPGEKLVEELLTADETLLRTRYDKIRMQKSTRFEPDRIDRFIHDLRSNVEIGNLKGIHDGINDLIPEMLGPDFNEMMQNFLS